VSATAINTTGAVLVDSGYADYSGQLSFAYDRYLNSPLVNCGIDGTSRVLCLAGIKVGNQAVTMYGSMSWIEIL
jgi:hypothetical protein